MNKTLRNKTLKDMHRLITVDMNGEDWYAPDGYFATAYPIYDGYRVKKDQELPTQKPLLHKILSSQPHVPADSVKLIAGDTNQFGYDVYEVKRGENTLYIQAVFYDLIKNIYSNHTVHIEESAYKYAPIEIKQNNVLVAVIMPLKG